MVLLKRFFCFAILGLFVCKTQSLPKISYRYDSESESPSSDSKHLQIHDFLQNGTKRCHGTADDIATFISDLEKMLVDNSFDRVDRLYKLLNSFEWTEARNATSLVKVLKKKVKHEAAQALCPVPDDPNLMGEFDVIIDLIYEMCIFNFIEEADTIRDSASARMEKLLTRINAVSESLQQDAVNPSKACSQLVKEVEAEVEEIEELEAIYKEKAQSVYSMCFQMAYKHAESYMPSMVKIATSCQVERFKKSVRSTTDIQETK